MQRNHLSLFQDMLMGSHSCIPAMRAACTATCAALTHHSREEISTTTPAFASSRFSFPCLSRFQSIQAALLFYFQFSNPCQFHTHQCHSTPKARAAYWTTLDGLGHEHLDSQDCQLAASESSIWFMVEKYATPITQRRGTGRKSRAVPPTS